MNMSPESSSEELLRVMDSYLLPEYWDGKVLGGPTAEPFIPNPCDRTSQQVAFRSLEGFLERQPAKPPFMIGQPYAKGEEFDASCHRPGSIFWINYETLAARRDHEPKPSPEADISLTKDPIDHELVIMWNGGARYARRNYWGVTGITRDERAILFLVPTHGEALSSKGEIIPKRTFNIPPTAVAGQAYHTRLRSHEVLWRANQIYQCLPGQARRRPAPRWRQALGFLARPAIINPSNR